MTKKCQTENIEKPSRKSNLWGEIRSSFQEKKKKKRRGNPAQIQKTQQLRSGHDYIISISLFRKITSIPGDFEN